MKAATKYLSIHKYIASLTVVGLVAGTAVAMAATSAQLTLTGTVQQILSIDVNPTAAASGLDLTGSVSALKVATVIAQSNNPGGYAVSASSQNQLSGDCTSSNGPCFHSATATTNDDMSFGLQRDSVAVSFVGATGTFVSTTARSAVGGDTYDAQISYDGITANLDQATDYSETLTLSIATN